MKRRLASACVALVALASCQRHEERDITGWLKVDISRPATGRSGMIVLGSSSETYHVKIDGSWKKLVSGHPSGHLVLDDPNKEYYEPGSQPAALIFHSHQGTSIVREGERALRSSEQAFGKNSDVFVPPNRNAVDVWDCQEGDIHAGCADLEIRRYHPQGTLTKVFRIPLRDTYPECHIGRIRWYDSMDIPYLEARCQPDSERAHCLLVAPRPDGLWVHVVGRERPVTDCNDFPRAGIGKGAPARFEVFD